MSSTIPDFNPLANLGDFEVDQQEDDLNKAIEELRGVLQDENAGADAVAGSVASSYA